MADQKTEPQQLYNVKQDPGQQDNLINRHPENAVEMREMLESIRSLDTGKTNQQQSKRQSQTSKTF